MILFILATIFAFARGPVALGEVSTVYSYQCLGNFLEGEGLSAYSIECLPHQRLGLIQAKYTAYLFSNPKESNFSQKLSERRYSSSLCGRHLLRLACDSTPVARFSLSRRPEGPFQVPVILSPTLNDNTRVYGYAASPEAGGACPAGLVKARLYEASPKTIDFPLPSSFVNYRGSQNDRIISLEEDSRSHFAVYRLANTIPCDGFGNCQDVMVGPPALAQVVPYVVAEEKPALCVLPRAAGSGRL